VGVSAGGWNTSLSALVVPFPSLEELLAFIDRRVRRI
jgi:hypothetical protein